MSEMSASHPEDEVLRPVGPGACPECGAPLAHEAGCVLCRSCGHSACG